MLLWFKHYNMVAVVSRLTYTDWAYNKGIFEPTGNAYKWHLKPNDIKTLLDKTMFWKEFTFTTIRNADIKEGDKLTIGTTTYEVSGEMPAQGITFTVKKFILYIAKWAAL